MEFAIRFNGGYEVCVLMPSDILGRNKYYPLRNFGDHQGDARIFKLNDCPNLTDVQIRMLIKLYNPNKKYKRINCRKFVVEN